ncbi:MAG: hypothetical protein GQE15_05710 [Archangiaceae bacterium]|nr:hypothetical protein [Archangiaceae bacterium]
MRTLVLVLLAVTSAACKKERVPLVIDGISSTVPEDWVTIDPERVEKLRNAAQTADGTVEVAMVGRKPPGAALPWMYLQRTSMRPLMAKPLPVKSVLEGTWLELNQALKESGLEVVSSTSSLELDSRENCYVTKSKKTPPVLNHTCMRLWVGKTTKKVHSVSVVCLATEGEDAECQRIIDARKLTANDALPLEQPLEPW